jgi:hypothetical protein
MMPISEIFGMCFVDLCEGRLSASKGPVMIGWQISIVTFVDFVKLTREE